MSNPFQNDSYEDWANPGNNKQLIVLLSVWF